MRQPTFAEELYSLANALLDQSDPAISWAGGQVARLADRARFLGARSGEDFDDKTQAMLDAALDARAAYDDAREAEDLAIWKNRR